MKLQIGGVIWDRWGKIRQIGWQIGGNLGQTRKYHLNSKLLGSSYLFIIYPNTKDRLKIRRQILVGHFWTKPTTLYRMLLY